MKLTIAPPRLGWILVLFCALVLARALFMADKVNLGFSDNLMRLVEVRDWLGGQGWFDMQQHRLLPPDGVSMHWSRYVDLGIAALLVPLSWMFPMPMAETLTLILWPTLLLMALCVVVVVGTDRLMGRGAAIGAGLIAVLWAKLGPGKFGPGSVDHHNVQLLFCTAALFLTIVPARDPVRGSALMGAAAGVAAAFTLAVGLEMLPILLLLWGMAAVRYALGTPGSRAWLAGFSIAIAAAAPLFMIGQTPVVEWLVPYCDELAPPMLSVIAAGVAASLVGVALGGRLQSPLARFAVMAAVAGLGLWLASPMLGACLAGPYGEMPEEARRIITDRIAEAQPAWRSFMILPYGVNALITPALAVVILAGGLGWRARHSLSAPQRQALVMTLVAAAIGLAISMIQIRALAVAAPAIPFLAGFIVAQVVALIAARRQRLGALVGFGAVLFILLPEIPLLAAMSVIRPDDPSETAAVADPDAWQPLAGSCRSQESLDELVGLNGTLPPGSIILSELNFGAMILAHTPYSATSAGYHRSADAFLNGVAPFQREPAMIDALRKSRSDYVLICRSGGGGGRYGMSLLAGDLPNWLLPTDGPQETIVLLRVDKDRLAAATQEPRDQPAVEVTQ
ncbi:MAG: hypothetical protein WAT09_00160 [Paracoccaceae bacterium]